MAKSYLRISSYLDKFIRFEGFNGDVMQRYFIKAISQNFLIDPDGKIVAKSLIGENLQKELAEQLK